VQEFAYLSSNEFAAEIALAKVKLVRGEQVLNPRFLS